MNIEEFASLFPKNFPAMTLKPVLRNRRLIGFRFSTAVLQKNTGQPSYVFRLTFGLQGSRNEVVCLGVDRRDLPPFDMMYKLAAIDTESGGLLKLALLNGIGLGEDPTLAEQIGMVQTAMKAGEGPIHAGR